MSAQKPQLAMLTQEKREATRRSRVKSVASSESILAYNAASSRLLVSRLKGQRLSLRERIFLLLYEPRSSPFAIALSVCIWVSLICSALASQLETVSLLTDVTGSLPWLCLRVGFNGFFTIEVVLRILTHIPMGASWRDPYLVIATLAVLPFWGRFLGSNSLREATYLLAHERWVTTRLLEYAPMH